MTKFLLPALLLISSSLTAVTYKVSTPQALGEAFSNVNPGDTILLAPGEYRISRIYYIKRSGNAKAPIIIQGAGIDKTTIIPLYTKAFRVFGHYIQFKNLTFRGRGGGVPFEAMGNHISVEWCSFEENNVGLDISGNHFRGRHLFIYSNEKTGIEVNGGFIWRESWSNDVIRLREALGLLPGKAYERDRWSETQLTEMEALWDRREMDCRLEYVYFHENGINRYPRKGYPDGWKYGQALYGGQLKAVPNVSGLTLYRCFATGGQWSNYWIDFPSKGENRFQELYAIGGQHGVHIEGGNFDPGEEADQRTIVEDCVFWNVHQGIFNSASATNVYRNNLIGAYKYGIINHGIKGNRTDLKTIASFENNQVYLFPSTVMRLGVTQREVPRGHLIWFSGPNAQGASRTGNTYYLSPDFPRLKVSNSTNADYSFSPANIGKKAPSESVVTVASIPNLILPFWIDQLPQFEKYVNVGEYEIGKKDNAENE